MTISNRCEKCGGELSFDFDTQELKCNQCENIVDIPDVKKLNEKKPFNENSTIKQTQVEVQTYKCENCGKTCIINQEELSLRCAYCGSPNLNRTTKIEYVPDGIVPFKLNKERAKTCFIDWLKKKHFLPSNLRKKISKSDFLPVYFPIYNYDFDCFSSYSGVGVIYGEDSDGNRTESTRYFSGTKPSRFSDYIESANKNLSSSILKDIGNYNFNNLYVYRTEYLYGITALEANVDLQNNCKIAKANIQTLIENSIKRDYHFDEIRQFSCNTTFNQISYNYLYVPVWIHKFLYNKKTFSFFINGLTGKVSGRVPRSLRKILLTVFGFLFFSGAIALLIYFLIK